MSEKGSVNLCNTYVLPLLGLNQWSFGSPGRFVNSYVAEDDEHIVVECTHPFSTIITHHANYKLGFERDGHYFAVFEVPSFYKSDVRRFRQGKYSQYSESAKSLIRKKSGLTYRAPSPGGGFRSALELLALDRDRELKKYWEDRIGVKIAEDAELMSIPGEENFFNLRLSNRLESTT